MGEVVSRVLAGKVGSPLVWGRFRGVQIGEADNPGPDGGVTQRPEPLPDHYATLGVARFSSVKLVKRAYRTLSLVNHPDKGGSQELF